MEYIAVVTIEEDVINDIKLFTDVQKAEKLFIETAKSAGITDENELDDCLSMGFFHTPLRTVCITHPDDKTDPKKLIICVDGGIVQEIYSSTPLDTVVLDWDIEGSDKKEIGTYPDSSGNLHSAYISYPEVDVVPEYCDKVFEHMQLIKDIPVDDTYTLEEWKSQVQNDITTLGYAEWVKLNKEGEND